MKNSIIFGLVGLLFSPAMQGCSGEETYVGPGSGNGNVSFKNAELYYYYDDFKEGTGSFGISLSNGDIEADSSQPYTELYLDFGSDYYENALDAVPAGGSYEFSDTYDSFTFNNEYSWFFESDASTQRTLGIVGGTFTIKRIFEGFSVDFDLKLGNGKMLKGRYEGPIAGEYQSTISTDTRLDFDSMPAINARTMKMDGGVWAISLAGEYGAGAQAGQQVETMLFINADDESELLPAGNFPMAQNTRMGREGMAEPAYAYSSEQGGCYMLSSTGINSWAVPGEGFVNIGKNDDGYIIMFSFVDSNGYEVWGSYTGDVYHVGTTRAGGSSGASFGSSFGAVASGHHAAVR